MKTIENNPYLLPLIGCIQNPGFGLLGLSLTFTCGLQYEVGTGPRGRHSAHNLAGMSNISRPVYPERLPVLLEVSELSSL